MPQDDNRAKSRTPTRTHTRLRKAIRSDDEQKSGSWSGGNEWSVGFSDWSRDGKKNPLRMFGDKDQGTGKGNGNGNSGWK